MFEQAGNIIRIMLPTSGGRQFPVSGSVFEKFNGKGELIRFAGSNQFVKPAKIAENVSGGNQCRTVIMQAGLAEMQQVIGDQFSVDSFVSGLVEAFFGDIHADKPGASG